MVGLDAASAAPPASKRCRACRQEKPLPDFRPGRSICRACRNVQNRESAARRHGPKTAEDDDEVHPAPLRSFVGGDYGGLVSRSDREAAEQRRELLASLRGNGVEHELRDGRQYVVLRLPEGERAPAPGEGAGRPARPARAIPLARLFERLRGRGGPRPRAIEGGDE